MNTTRGSYSIRMFLSNQAVTVNIHYPMYNTWSKEVSEDLESYISAEDKQGELQVTHTWKDSIQKAVTTLTNEDKLGMWNWDENHHLGHIKKNPLAWRTSVRAVYKKICNGYSAREYMYVLTSMFLTRNQLCNACTEVPVIMDKYVEDMFCTNFWMQVIVKRRQIWRTPHTTIIRRE
jgi:hypothetical protein